MFQPQKLLRLAKFLREEVPANKFQLSHWASKDWKDGGDGGVCGTTACAVGWATTIPEFRKEGLCLYKNKYWEYLEPAFKGATHFEAAAKFFGISWEEACFLFDPERYGRSKSRDTVIKRIEDFVKCKTEMAEAET